MNFRTLSDFDYDGRDILIQLLKLSEWGSVEQAIASLSIFAHLDVVKAVGSRAVIYVARAKGDNKRQTINQNEHVLYDDNESIKSIFRLATGFRPGNKSDLRCNHIYGPSDDHLRYADLRNLCYTPEFLAKFTDNQQIVLPPRHILHILYYRTYELYGYDGLNGTVPPKPEGYEKLLWADTVGVGRTKQSIEQDFINKFSNRKSYITKALRDIGWTFSNYEPDPRFLYLGR